MPKVFNLGDIATLVEAAATSNKKISRICLHEQTSVSPQEMMICHLQGSTDWPHRNNGNRITLTIVEGTMSIVVFDDHGNVNQVFRLDRESGIISLQLEGHQYLSCIAESEYAILHEVIYGPWDEQKKDFYPGWARPRSSERNKCADNKEDFDLEKFISNLKCELRQK